MSLDSPYGGESRLGAKWPRVRLVMPMAARGPTGTSLGPTWCPSPDTDVRAVVVQGRPALGSLRIPGRPRAGTL